MDRYFYLDQCVHTDSGTGTAEYPVVTRVQLDMTIQSDLLVFVVFSSYCRSANIRYDRSFSISFKINFLHRYVISVDIVSLNYVLATEQTRVSFACRKQRP
jgi:hypothetical protein